MTEVERLRRLLLEAQHKSTKAQESRMRLPAGSSRARVTTANARWARAAEHRDRLQDQLTSAEMTAAYGNKP